MARNRKILPPPPWEPFTIPAWPVGLALSGSLLYFMWRGTPVQKKWATAGWVVLWGASSWQLFSTGQEIT